MAIGAAARELIWSIVKHKDKRTLLLLKESQFASADEVKAFRELKRHVNRHGEFPTKPTVRNRFKVPFIATPEPVSFYFDGLINRAKYNTIRNEYPALTEAMSSMDVEAAERILSSMNSKVKMLSSNIGGAVKTFDDIAQEVIADYRLAQMSGGMRGITCGWPEIDLETGGYANGDLAAWVARLGRGKTWLLLYQAFHAAMANKSVMFVSPEVPDVQLVRRMIGILTGLNPRLIARGQLSTDLYRGMVQTIDGIRNQLPIVFAAVNYKKSMPFVNAMVEQFEPDIVFIDAAYLVSPEKKRGGSGGRREVISDVIEEIKDSATSQNIPYVISVQFNRQAVKSEKNEGEQRTRANPLAHLGMHKIGETDVIGQVASLVFAAELGDAPNVNNERWIGIQKGREGEGGFWKINYKFNPFDFSVKQHGQNSSAQAEINEEELDAEID